MYKKTLILFISYILSCSIVLADDNKDGVISKLTGSISSGIENIIAGDGDTEVNITAGQDYKPEFSIMTVRPIALHPSVDAWFVQLQLNDVKVRGGSRNSINAGLGYRKLSEDKTSFTGGNVFVDWDEKGNARASIGLELKSAAFEAMINYYQSISGGKTVGDFTERTLGGYDATIVGEVPFLPWANLVLNNYEWQAEKGSSDNSGTKYSLEMTITPNFIIEGGGNDNSADGYNRFVKAYLVFPGKNRVAATTNFIGESIFSSQVDMSDALLSKVRRSNKIIIESEGTGVVMTRGD